MTRRFLDNIRADFATQLALATPLDKNVMIALHLDQLDSTIDDEAGISSNAESIDVPTAIDWSPLLVDGVGGNLFDVVTGGDTEFLKVVIANGGIGLSTVAGYTYSMVGYISFNSIGTSQPIDFSILVDGVASGFEAKMTGDGNTRPLTATFRNLELSAGGDALVQIGCRTPNGANNIDIQSIGLLVAIKPTNNP